jgi:threonine synthase
VAIAHARQLGARAIGAASTGNAASSLATLAARAQLPCYIFAPDSAPPAKLTQIRVHGARLFLVAGSYDEAFDLCTAASQQLGFYNRNTAINPYLGEGKKTIALEIWEQLGYRAPDVVLVPVGDGCILGGVFKGFRDLYELGLIPALPRIVGVQAAGASPLADAWRAGVEQCQPAAAATIADSICVGRPRDQIKALRAVRASGGAFLTVTDEQILAALAQLATRAGLFVEPAAAATLAGLERGLATGGLDAGEETVAVVTGHGLKDTAAADRAAGWNQPVGVRPKIEALRGVLQ